MIRAMPSPETMRRLDRWLGGAACAVLAATGGRRGPREFRPDAGADVLVMQLAEMGSMVLALPALEVLRAEIPGVRLHFLVARESRALPEALRLAPPERIHELDFSSPVRLVASFWRALRACRRAKLAATIHLDFFARSHAAFAALACPRGERVGFDDERRRGRRALLTRPVMYSAHHHTSVMFLALVRSLFLPPDAAPFARVCIDGVPALPTYRPTERDLDEVRAKLGGAASRPLLLISPNASERLALRRWPVANFSAAVQQWLETHPEWQAVLIGTASDREAARSVAPGHPRLTDLTGQTSLEELLALMTTAQLLLCNDSGPAHFASVARLPSVVLFGPETPALYAPLGGRARCLHAGFVCSPCVSAHNDKSSSCPRSLCLEHITVDEVLAAMHAATASPA
jgi:ADP-heptose:LPS heptosyltransferase